uniref:Copper transporter n=1 Tax=Florenciella parvula TaxID=236787 RepID=A0A7S2BCZ3_9STRA
MAGTRRPRAPATLGVETTALVLLSWIASSWAASSTTDSPTMTPAPTVTSMPSSYPTLDYGFSDVYYEVEFYAGLGGCGLAVIGFFVYLCMSRQHIQEARLKRRAKWAQRFNRTEFNLVTGEALMIDHEDD